MDVAKSISHGFARNVLSGNYNGNTIELNDPLTVDGNLVLFTWNDIEGKAARLQEAHLLGFLQRVGGLGAEALAPGITGARDVGQQATRHEHRPGLLDVGRYPHGVDDFCVDLAATLRAATFGSIPRDDIMAWKYRKLLMNLGNAIEAVCGRSGFDGRLYEMVSAEGEAALATAGVTVVSPEEDRARRGDALTIQPVGTLMRTSKRPKLL